MEVYLDLVVLLNFLVDFFLILGTNRLSGCPPGGKRAALAAALGAVYAGLCVLPTLAFLRNFFWRLVCLGLMSGIAFGWNKGAVRRGILLVFLSMALGGIALGLGEGGFWSVVLGAVGVALLCITGFQGRPGQQRYVPVSITHGGKTVQLMALVDTGNALRDPISGRAVLVADADSAYRLLGLTRQQLAQPLKTVSSCKELHLRLIPYHAVGQPGGMLLALRVDALEMNGKKEDLLVAFAPQQIGKTYQALTGGIV